MQINKVSSTNFGMAYRFTSSKEQFVDCFNKMGEKQADALNCKIRGVIRDLAYTKYVDLESYVDNGLFKTQILVKRPVLDTDGKVTKSEERILSNEENLRKIADNALVLEDECIKMAKIRQGQAGILNYMYEDGKLFE